MGKTKRNLPSERYWKSPKHKQRNQEGPKSERHCQYEEVPVAAFKEVHGGLQKNYFDKKR